MKPWKVDILIHEYGHDTVKTREFETEERAKEYFQDMMDMWNEECHTMMAIHPGNIDYYVRPHSKPYKDSND